MTDTYIAIKDGKVTSYVGHDATRYAAVRILRSAIKLHRDTGMIPTRGVTIGRMLTQVSDMTGKRYTGKDKHNQAIADLDIWLNNMRSALPVTEG